MAKTKQKRTYKCGACKELGHNARTCPTKAAKAAPAPAPTPAPAPAPAPVPEPKTEESPVPEDPAHHPMDGSVDLVHGFKAPSGRPAVPAAPYECSTCERVGILVLVELEGGASALRCEHCQNKTPIKSILKWGAFPSDKPKQPR